MAVQPSPASPTISVLRAIELAKPGVEGNEFPLMDEQCRLPVRELKQQK